MRRGKRETLTTKKEVVVGELSVFSYQLSALEVILKSEDLEVSKRSSRLCTDLNKHI